MNGLEVFDLQPTGFVANLLGRRPIKALKLSIRFDEKLQSVLGRARRLKLCITNLGEWQKGLATADSLPHTARWGSGSAPA
jgi:hypothetical protein